MTDQQRTNHPPALARLARRESEQEIAVVGGPENRPQPVNILAMFGAAPKQAPLEFCSAKCAGAYFLLLGVSEEAQA